MLTFEDLIDTIKIEPPISFEGNIPEISQELIPEELTIRPDCLEKLNRILKYFDLPQFYSSDGLEEKLIKIKKIKKNKSFNTDKLLAKYNKIMLYKGYENDCDMNEILIANTELIGIKKYSNMTLEELNNYLNDLRDSMNFQGAINNLGRYKEELVSSLYFLKDKLYGIYIKEKVKNLLLNCEELWCKILFKIINENNCKVEEISNDLQVDRVSVLKIIYNFCSKEILRYDRVNDSVSIENS